MYLEFSYCPDIRCPRCKLGLDVYTSYEEDDSSINDNRNCPRCGILLYVKAVRGLFTVTTSNQTPTTNLFLREEDD